jgi:hypothetical protein
VFAELPHCASFSFPPFLLTFAESLSQQLEERDPSQTDAEQMAHVQELLGKLDAAGIVASSGAATAEEGWEDASEDEEAMEE